jgi:hypothetical protein
MQPTRDRTQEEFDADKPYILRTIIDTLLEAKNLSAKDLRRLDNPAELIAAADSGNVREQPHFAAYMLGDNVTERIKTRLTDVNFDREGEGYENVRLPSFAFGQDVPTAPWNQPAPAAQREAEQRNNVAEQAIEEATRATERNAEATESLVEPVDSLRRAFIGFLGYNADNVLPHATGGGMRGGGNNNQPPAGPPPNNNQGGNQNGRNRRNRRGGSGLWARINRRGAARAITRGAAAFGGRGAARIAAGVAGAFGGPVGITIATGLGLVAMGLRKTVSALKSFSDSAWEMTNRVGKYSAEITLASAMLDAHRMMRDVRMAREIGPAAAENIRQKDRLEENMMPINAMIGRIGHFVDNLVLRFQNFALEEIINPQLGNEQEAADKAVPIAVGVGQKVLEFLGRINPALGAFVPLAEEMGKVAIAMDAVAEAERKAAVEKADREAAEAHKKAQEEMRDRNRKSVAPQMDNLNAMMNSLWDGRRPF